MDINQIKKEVKENLQLFDLMQDKYKLYSANAYNLLLGTIAQESNYKYVKQLDNGPARSYFQIEPATASDILVNYVIYRTDLFNILNRISKLKINDFTNLNKIGEELLNNFQFATFIARLCYYRRSFNFFSGDVRELALIWKKYYNTIHGAGTIEEFIKNYKKYVDI